MERKEAIGAEREARRGEYEGRSGEGRMLPECVRERGGMRAS